MFLFLARHGRPDLMNDCLTREGKKQAKALAKRFSLLGLDKIYSSTMGRTMQTADFTAKRLGLEIEGLEFAREDLAWKEFAVKSDGGTFSWCFWIKKYIDEFNSEEVKNLGYSWFESPLFKETKFKSGFLRVKEETIKFMNNLGYSYDEKTGTYTVKQHIYNKVAFFAHGGFSMIFLSCLLNIPYPIFATRFHMVSTSGVTVVHIADTGKNLTPRIFQYGNDSHSSKNLLSGFELRTF